MADIKESLAKLTYPAGPWIEETRVKLGQGHYGTVQAVKIRGLQCAGKKFVLADDDSEIRKRFVEQCLQLAQIRHPNFVQLLGVFFDTKSVPTVVSEVFPLNLAKCLDDYQHMPKYAKSSILLDVANGFRYAHEQKQPMVHGRLCAEKILLTISLQAKICGFVNPSEVVLPDSSYNAPEVAKGTLTIKGDVFSFGNLVLHVATQTYPQPTSKEKQDPSDPSQTVTCSETERREQSLKLLGESHALQGLVKQCLADDPSSRPTTAELLQEVEQHAVSTPPPYASVLQVMQEVEQATLLKENIAALTQAVEGKQTELDAKELEIDGLKQELDVKEKTISAFKDEIETYKQTVQSKDRRMMMHDQALRAKDSLIKAKAREILSKNQQLSAKDSQLAASNRRIATLEERLAAGKAHGLRIPTTPSQRSPSRSPAVTRSQQVSPTFKESPYKFSQSAEAEDLAARAGEVLRRSVPGRRGKTVPMSDGIFFQNAKFEPAKSGIYGQQPVDPKLAAILARRHQRYESIESQPSKNLEPGQQTKATESTSGQVQLKKQQENQRSRSSSASSGMSPELQKMMDRRRSQLIDEESPPPVPQPPETLTKTRQRSDPTPPPVPPRPVMPDEEPTPPKQPQQQDPSPPKEPEQQDPSLPKEPEQQDPSPPEQQDQLPPKETQQQDPSSHEEPQQQDEKPEQQDSSPLKESEQDHEQQVPAHSDDPQQQNSVLKEPEQQNTALPTESQQPDATSLEEQQQQDPTHSEEPTEQNHIPKEQVAQNSISPSENQQQESKSADLPPQTQESEPIENGAKETEV